MLNICIGIISANMFISFTVFIYVLLRLCVSVSFIEVVGGTLRICSILDEFGISNWNKFCKRRKFFEFIFMCVYALQIFEENKQIRNWFCGIHLHRKSIIATMLGYFGFLIGLFPRANQNTVCRSNFGLFILLRIIYVDSHGACISYHKKKEMNHTNLTNQQVKPVTHICS